MQTFTYFWAANVQVSVQQQLGFISFGISIMYKKSILTKKLDSARSLRRFQSDITRHQSLIVRSTSLGAAEAGTIKLDLGRRSVGLQFFLRIYFLHEKGYNSYLYCHK